jgi:hypothetical protein
LKQKDRYDYIHEKVGGNYERRNKKKIVLNKIVEAAKMYCLMCAAYQYVLYAIVKNEYSPEGEVPQETIGWLVGKYEMVSLHRIFPF